MGPEWQDALPIFPIHIIKKLNAANICPRGCAVRHVHCIEIRTFPWREIPPTKNLLAENMLHCRTVQGLLYHCIQNLTSCRLGEPANSGCLTSLELDLEKLMWKSLANGPVDVCKKTVNLSPLGPWAAQA